MSKSPPKCSPIFKALIGASLVIYSKKVMKDTEDQDYDLGSLARYLVKLRFMRSSKPNKVSNDETA